MIRTLLKSVREYRKQTITTPILVVIEAAIETLIPFLMAMIIDRGINAGNMTIVIRVGVLLLIMAVLSLMMGAGASWISSIAAAGFAKNLRQDLFYHIQTFSFQNLDQFPTSSLVTRLTTDITNLQTAFQMAIRIAFRAPSMLIFSIIMAFTVSSEMASLFVVAIPILAIGLWLIVRYSRPLFRQVFQRYDQLNRVVRENLRGIRVVKTYGQQAAEISKFKAASGSIFKTFSKAQRIVALNMPVMQFVINTTMLLLSWYGAHLIVGNQLQVGQLVSLFSYSMSILFSLNMLSMIFSQLSVAQASAERVIAVMQTKPSITDDDQALTTVTNGEVVFEHVSMQYPGTHTPQLKDVNLRIKSGSMVGIIGETGSAKSTLVELIPRLYDVSEGRVLVAGHDVRDYDLKALRDNVAMVLQNTMLFSGTIAENLRWGNADATDEQLQTAAKMAQADEFVQSLPQKYDTYIEQNGQNISGGQRQRLTIARALLKQPQILILDDSTSATDTRTDAAIRAAFKTQLPNVTKLMITQRVTSVQEADEIIVMQAGQVAAVGTHAELLATNGWYKQLADSQEKQGGDAHAGLTQ
ncbi:ABC multidrug transporter, ATPase and permease component [Secundilactobacillus kimchicus JCM 15530]|uniref:ABC multidrug transporter, ATPase and permease component n=1 Tax=Secundilactobacillus kimchicus JCM 15530 TaxID=1302272 RepID=A0A0R1HPY3_9LACO|nr:ABC transporter ATP-binding protein [Secundilactobacillus kimchicus]KRK48704.1 ABC multidrug transporter, ATPase and permease component [Secundilactobacillus kimchicus JCM 15530]